MYSNNIVPTTFIITSVFKFAWQAVDNACWNMSNGDYAPTSDAESQALLQSDIDFNEIKEWLDSTLALPLINETLALRQEGLKNLISFLRERDDHVYTYGGYLAVDYLLATWLADHWGE